MSVSRVTRRFFLAITFMLFVPPFTASAEEQAKSLNELLQLIKNAKVNESKQHQERELAFRNARDKQQILLEEARAIRAKLEARSTELENLFADNEKGLQALQAQMENRLGSLKELFGHVSAAAADTASRVEQSLVSVEYPNRSDWLRRLIAAMSSNSHLPSVEDIERLSFEMSREMIAGGQVSRFTAEVLNADGSWNEREVVRIGTFNIVSDGHYLTYSPKSGVLAELAHQPRSLGKSAQKLQSATSGISAVRVDPTGPSGGGLLRTIVDRPGWSEKWHQGGLVGYLITGLGVFALILVLWRGLVLRSVYIRVKAQLGTQHRTERGQGDLQDNPLGRVLSVADANTELDPETMELKLHEAILKERPGIEYGLNLLRIIAMIAPLMGLLGTVTGMIVVFQQITIFGAGDPKLMAGGIAQALVTTVLGLIVAIPILLLHTWVSTYARGILHVLEEQSAGIIALKAESNASTLSE